VSILSQPFPYLLLEAKREMFRQRGLDPAVFPLGDLFRESRYSREELRRSLATFSPASDRLGELFREMQAFSGQYTRFTSEQISRALAAPRPPGLAALLRTFWRLFASKEGASRFGAKEVTAEEFMPSLLDAGIHVVLVVRDPRDVVASLNTGDGLRYGGRRKPTLANVRLWRKSVAFALRYAEHTAVTVVRYEDVAKEPMAPLRPVFTALVLDPAEASTTPREPSGAEWRGNSSYGDVAGVTSRSVGAFRARLPRDVVAFIEATCHPEMRALGYAADLEPGEAARAINAFVDPYASERPELSGYVTDEARASELERLERLRRVTRTDDAEWFLFDEAAERLRRS